MKKLILKSQSLAPKHTKESTFQLILLPVPLGETHAVRITKLHFKTRRKKVEKAHLIVSENPLNFEILGIRPSLEKLTLGPLLKL